MIPYGRQDISEEDIAAVKAVLESDFLTQGPAVPRFEQKLAKKCGATHAIAVNSATSALHIAYLALGVRSGDRVWTVPNTFVATANAALYCGADIDFVDIDLKSYNMSVEALEHKLEQADKNGQLPKLVVPVHFAGQSCDMENIARLGQKYGFHIVEDASHAVGGSYKGAPVGNCAYSDMTIFSFHPVKIITSGEGGMVLTNNADLAEKLDLLRSHGVTRKPELMRKDVELGGWVYQQVDLGFNYRMTDIQAALGASQVTRLEQFIDQRHQLAKRYDKAFADLDIIIPWQHPDSRSAYHLYPIRWPDGTGGKNRLESFTALRENNILVNVHYIPVHTQPWYRDLGFKLGQFPQAEAYYSEAISLPLFASLVIADQDEVIRCLQTIAQDK